MLLFYEFGPVFEEILQTSFAVLPTDRPVSGDKSLAISFSYITVLCCCVAVYCVCLLYMYGRCQGTVRVFGLQCFLVCRVQIWTG